MDERYCQETPRQTVLNVNAPRNRARTVAFVAAAVLCVVLSIIAVSMTVMFCSAASRISGSSDLLASSSPKVGIISLDGTIQYDGTSCSPSGLRSLLMQAKQREDIKAVVLRINSGGGTATAGEEMARYVADFQKPIVVSCAATTASAAYEIASQADYIYTAKTSAVGSIGVAMQVTDLSGLYDKLGIDIDTITSSKSKDSTYGNRPLTKEERAYYQKMVDQIDDDFINTVAIGRNMPVEKVRELATGLTFMGEESVANGLADKVGYLEDAVGKAASLAGFDSSIEQTSLTLKTSPDIASLLDLYGQGQSGISGDMTIDEAMSVLKGSE